MIPVEAGTRLPFSGLEGEFGSFCSVRRADTTFQLDDSTSGNWHEEQIDELFASLLGRTFVPAAGRTDVERDDVAADGASGPTAQNVDVGSLRLFG